jgi:hypothetical protein
VLMLQNGVLGCACHQRWPLLALSCAR